MRIRGTKPEFWKSKRICSVSWDARLVLKGLESYVDDNGVGVDDIELIVTDVFPRDMFASPRETVARVSEAITELHQAGLVHRYKATADRLLYISFWESIQRIDKPGKGRNPRPDGTLDYKESEIRESVARPPETLAPVTGEQRNRGTEEQSSSSEISNEIVRPDVQELLDLLDSCLEINGSKKPSRTKRNRDAARLLIDADGYTVDQVAWIIRWATKDEFWRANILSMSKLRQKFDQLKAKAGVGATKPVSGFNGEIDVDAILGRDVWTPGTPPAGLDINGEIEWKKQQRTAHKADRMAEAKAKLGARA